MSHHANIQNLTPFAPGHVNIARRGGRPRNRLYDEVGMLVILSGNPVKLWFATEKEAQEFVKPFASFARRGLRLRIKRNQVTVSRT